MPESLPTVPSGMPAATPDERAAYAIARPASRRARHACAEEARLAREAIAHWAWRASAGSGMTELAGAVDRLRRLLERIAELDAKAEAAPAVQGPDCYQCETTGYNCIAHRS